MSNRSFGGPKATGKREFFRPSEDRLTLPASLAKDRTIDFRYTAMLYYTILVRELICETYEYENFLDFQRES